MKACKVTDTDSNERIDFVIIVSQVVWKFLEPMHKFYVHLLMLKKYHKGIKLYYNFNKLTEILLI